MKKNKSVVALDRLSRGIEGQEPEFPELDPTVLDDQKNNAGSLEENTESNPGNQDLRGV